MGLIQSQHKYTLRKVGGGLFKPSKTEITVKQELSGKIHLPLCKVPETVIGCCRDQPVCFSPQV